MPWSEWQNGFTFEPTNGLRRQVVRYTTDDGVSPSANRVLVTEASTSGAAQMLHYKPVAGSATGQHTRVGWLVGANPEWAHEARPAPPALSSLVRGTDYAVRPDRTGVEADAFIEYESGLNTMAWKPLSLTLITNTGSPAGDFRVRIVPNPTFDINPPAAGGELPLSTWPDSMVGDVVFSGPASTPVATYTVIGTVTPPSVEKFLIFVESDTARTTGITQLSVGFNDAAPKPQLTTPRWRYWIPDVAPSHPVIAPNRSVRSMVVDCTETAPVVVSDAYVGCDQIFGDSSYFPALLKVPSLGVHVVANAAYYQAPSVRVTVSVWNEDGTKRGEATLYEGSTGSTWPALGIFGNPDDPTECAVVLENGDIHVVSDLDTTPRHSATITGLPTLNGREDNWPYAATNPYLKGPGLVNSGQAHEDPRATNPINAVNWHQPGPTEVIGQTPVSAWEIIGYASASETGQRLVWGQLGDLSDESDPEWLPHPVVHIVDYRNQDAPVTTEAVRYDVKHLLPMWVDGPSSLDYLSSGSFQLAASGKHGVILSGYTALSDAIRTDLRPGQTLYGDQFSVVVTKIAMPADAEGDPTPDTLGLPEPATIVLEPLAVAWEGFYNTNLGYRPQTPLATTPANGAVVGTAPVLASADQGASYLEYNQTTTDYSVSSMISQRLAAWAPSDDTRLDGVEVDLEYQSTGNPKALRFYVWLSPLDTNGNLSGEQRSYNFPIPATEAGGWRRVSLRISDLEGDAVDALAAGRLLVTIDPSGGSNNQASGWGFRASYVETRAVLMT